MFFIAGFLVILIKKNNPNHLQISLYVAAFLLYFSALSCKTDRYPILALPFIAMISAHGTIWAFSRINKKYIRFGVLLIFAISLSLAFNYTLNGLNNKFKINNEFYLYLSDKQANGEVLTTTPFLAINSDSKLNIIYYPIYNSTIADYYSDYVIKNKPEISYIFVNTDDIPCPPMDLECPKKTAQFINLLKNNFKTAYYKKIGDNEYFIFSQ